MALRPVRYALRLRTHRLCDAGLRNRWLFPCFFMTFGDPYVSSNLTMEHPLIAPPHGMCPADFDAIEAAVMETERGRWFLAEFARRRRAEDNGRVLAAIDRLEARVLEADAAEARARLDADRAARLLGEVAALVRDLRPPGEARELPPPSARSAEGLEARLAALVELDSLDVETKLNLFS